MARQDINFGISPNDGTGDTLRVAMDKINDNFIELYGETSNENNLTFGVNSISAANIDGSLILETNGTGTVQVSQGLLVNTGEENVSSRFYAADGTEQLTIDVSTKRIGINKTTPTTTLDVVGTGAFSGNVTVAATLTVGSSGSDRLNINSTIFGSLIPGTTYALGSLTNRWSNLFASNADITAITSNAITTGSISATSGLSGTLTGQVIVSNGNIRILDGAFVSTIDSATLTANQAVNFPDRSGTIVVNTIAGRMTAPTTGAPTVSTGAVGDKAGDLAFDASYIYYCIADYDGSTVIWRRATLASW